MYRHLVCNILFGALTLFLAHIACASVVIDNTRAIYPERAREITVRLKNHSTKPVLIQSWLDSGDSNSDPTLTPSPFIVTPPLFRLDGERGQTLRIQLIESDTLPGDRESLYWLNVLDVPTKLEQKENTIRVALRSRIKLFYRPSGLAGNPVQAVHELIWQRTTNGITAINPSPWYVSLVSIATTGNTFAADTVAPKSRRTFDGKFTHVEAINFLWIDDNGSTHSQSAVIK